MAMYYIKKTGWWNTANYTGSQTLNPVDGTQLLILAQIRNNIYAHSGSEPFFGSDRFTRIIPQIGYQWPNEGTLEVFYLLNPVTSSDTLTYYQGIQGDPSTVQSMHILVMEASASAGKIIQPETATSSYQTINDPSIEVQASNGSLVVEITAHGDSVISGDNGAQSYVTKSDFGSWCGYVNYAIPTTGSGLVPFFYNLGNTEKTLNVAVSFAETDANVSNVVNFLHDEVPRY